MDVPQARVAVLDGTAHAPGQPWKHGKQTIKTLWGELAWQLGGAEALRWSRRPTPPAPRRARMCSATLLDRLCARAWS